MPKEYILIVAEGCPSCEAVKERIKGDSRFKVLDITKQNEAAAIAQKLGIDAVPIIVEVDHEANTICTVDKNVETKCARYQPLPLEV